MLSDGHLGTLITDRNGRAGLHTFKDLDLDDLIGMSVVLQGRQEDFSLRHTSNMAQVSASAKQFVDGPAPVCRCNGMVVFVSNDGNNTYAVPCPNGADMCTQAECEDAYDGICPYCTDENVAESVNR